MATIVTRAGKGSTLTTVEMDANLTNLNTDKAETASKDASGGYAGLTLFKLNMRNVANTFTSWLTNTNTAARTYTLPDADGTIADIASAQTFTNKTWNGGVVAGQYGGTGVANTGKTITIGGSLTTTGAATPTLAFGTGAFTYTFPAATGTLVTGGGTASGTNTGDNAANTTYASDYRAANFVAGTHYLAPTGSAAALTSFPTLNQNTSGYAEALKSATTTVSVSAATAPTSGQVLTATSGTTATWQGAVGVGNHAVVVHTGNGLGNTNTRCRRYTTALTNVGTDISYSDNVNNGASFTINATGLYAIFVSDATGAAGTLIIGVSVNTTQGSAVIEAINIADRLLTAYAPASSASSGASGSCVAYLTTGDVVRPHHGGQTPNATSNLAYFSIRRVG